MNEVQPIRGPEVIEKMKNILLKRSYRDWFMFVMGINTGLRISEIGTHTLRKTFGYHFYKRTKVVALPQDIFNHSAPSITLRYIGINQDIIDQAIEDFSL